MAPPCRVYELLLGLLLVVEARIEDTSSLVNKTVKMPTPPLIRLAMVVVAHLVNKTVKMPTPPLMREALFHFHCRWDLQGQRQMIIH